jgi:hypothetical protein
MLWLHPWLQLELSVNLFVFAGRFTFWVLHFK